MDPIIIALTLNTSRDLSEVQLKKTAPYGSWKSAIDALHVAETGTGSTLSVTSLQVDQNDVYWIERQSAQSGRQTIVKRSSDGYIKSVLPAPYSARTRAHEYGGGDYCVEGGLIIFANDQDQAVYLLREGADPRRLTNVPEVPHKWRFADFKLAPDGKHLVAVRERHGSRVTNELVRIPLDGSGDVQVVMAGADFYSSPRFSPDGRSLAWLEWNHPCMPWDGTELWVARLDSGLDLSDKTRVAGSPLESIFQPEWGKNGEMFFLSDRSGWWNLYQEMSKEVSQITTLQADLGYPQWTFGFSRYVQLSDHRIVSIITEEGIDRLTLIDPLSGSIERIPLPYTSFSPPYLRADAGDHLWVIGGSFHEFPSILRLDLQGMQAEIIHRTSELELEGGSISVPDFIHFSSTDTDTRFGFFYPPLNARIQGPAQESPPLIVMAHGGPTSAAKAHLQLEIQFWTSRGFGLVDVNYAGSIGYGREYRDRLKGEWGVFDVSDCIHAAKHLITRGLADRNRVAIRGKSAGGYTALSALAFHDFFSAAVVYYGVGDLQALSDDTHKFESHYLDSLIGSAPDADRIFHERSPLFHAESINCPLLIFQGLKDRVVSPDQAEILKAALEKNRIPYAYFSYPDEGHGFRKADNIIHALRTEYAFLCKIFGITPPEKLAEIALHHPG